MFKTAKLVLSSLWLSVFLVGGTAAFAAEEDASDKAGSSSKGPQTRISGWKAQCMSPGRKDPLMCNVDQAIYLAETGQQLSKVSVRLLGGGKAPEMVIQLPHGLYLPKGITVNVDAGSAKTYPVHTCDATACYVILDDATAAVVSMKAGKTLQVAFQNLGRDEITVSVPLDGFSAAYKKAE